MTSAVTEEGIPVQLIAVAWHFTQKMLLEVVPAASYPSIVAFSAKAEALSEFKAAPHGDSTYRHEG